MPYEELKYYPIEHPFVVAQFLGQIPNRCPECGGVGHKTHEEFGVVPCVCGQCICPGCKGLGNTNFVTCVDCWGMGWQIALPRLVG